MFEYPNNLQIIFDKLNINGIKSIIIGGYIRDSLLNIKSKDIDIELYGVSSFDKLEKLLEEFGSVNNVGKSFGVCKLSLENIEIDFTLPRIDNKVSSGHCGFNVEVQADLDFERATSRRDFTINAIGYDVIEKKILDPFNGQNDLNNKILKAVNIKTFAEDPLRVLRAAGFCSRFDLSISDELFILCKDMCNKDVLGELASERIFSEIKKILLKSPKPSIGFRLLKELNALKYLAPLQDLDKNSFENVLDAVDNITRLKTNSNKTNITLMLATLCYKFNSEQIKEFISNLTDEKELLKNILTLLDNSFKNGYSDSELFRLATKVNIEHFLILNRAINSSLNNKIFNELEIRARELNIFNSGATPFLQGRDILAFGIKPSKEYSTILNLAYSAQINLEIQSHEEAIEWLKRYLLS